MDSVHLVLSATANPADDYRNGNDLPARCRGPRHGDIKMKPIAFAVILGVIAGSVTALAAGKSITQKGKVFSESEISIKKGETVIFVNDDNITHNIFSTSSGNAFNIGAQAPGVSTPVKFANAGEVTVLCAIHPRMQMAVKVSE
jgi:plastocyanin